MTGQVMTDNAAHESEAVRGLMKQAEAAPTYEEALPFVAEAITAQLLEAMKASKIPKAENAVEALKKSGLDKLLVEALLRGRLTFQAADRHLNRMREAIKARHTPIVDL